MPNSTSNCHEHLLLLVLVQVLPQDVHVVSVVLVESLLVPEGGCQLLQLVNQIVGVDKQNNVAYDEENSINLQ